MGRRGGQACKWERLSVRGCEGGRHERGVVECCKGVQSIGQYLFIDISRARPLVSGCAALGGAAAVNSHRSVSVRA